MSVTLLSILLSTLTALVLAPVQHTAFCVLPGRITLHQMIRVSRVRTDSMQRRDQQVAAAVSLGGSSLSLDPMQIVHLTALSVPQVSFPLQLAHSRLMPVLHVLWEGSGPNLLVTVHLRVHAHTWLAQSARLAALRLDIAMLVAQETSQLIPARKQRVLESRRVLCFAAHVPLD